MNIVSRCFIQISLFNNYMLYLYKSSGLTFGHPFSRLGNAQARLALLSLLNGLTSSNRLATRQCLSTLSIALTAQRIPTLCFELEFLVVTGDKDLTKTSICDVANELDVVHILYLLVVANRNGEQ